MKKSFYKRITRYWGYARGDLWDFNGKTRKIIKRNDARRYRRYRRDTMRKDLEFTDPFLFFRKFYTFSSENIKGGF